MSKPLTGPQIHDAYNQTLQDDVTENKKKYPVGPLRLWSELSSEQKWKYDHMAKYLNRLLGLKPEQEEDKP